MKFLE